MNDTGLKFKARKYFDSPQIYSLSLFKLSLSHMFSLLVLSNERKKFPECHPFVMRYLVLWYKT